MVIFIINWKSLAQSIIHLLQVMTNVATRFPKQSKFGNTDTFAFAKKAIIASLQTHTWQQANNDLNHTYQVKENIARGQGHGQGDRATSGCGCDCALTSLPYYYKDDGCITKRFPNKYQRGGGWSTILRITGLIKCVYIPLPVIVGSFCSKYGQFL